MSQSSLRIPIVLTPVPKLEGIVGHTVSILTEDSDRSNCLQNAIVSTTLNKSQSSLRIPIVLTTKEAMYAVASLPVSILTEDSDRSNYTRRSDRFTSLLSQSSLRIPIVLTYRFMPY